VIRLLSNAFAAAAAVTTTTSTAECLVPHIIFSLLLVMAPHSESDSGTESLAAQKTTQAKEKQEILIDGKWVDVTSFMNRCDPHLTPDCLWIWPDLRQYAAILDPPFSWSYILDSQDMFILYWISLRRNSHLLGGFEE